MNFITNQNLDVDEIAQDYAVDLRVKVSNFLPENQARDLSECLAGLSSYRHAFIHGGKFGEASREDLRALPEPDRNRFISDIMKQAANGVGFWYERHQVTLEDEGLIGDMFSWLNSEALLETIAKITATPQFGGAIAQATRFRRGDFLTRHQDIVTKERRKVAFVINLSQRWHPDWGGLLQFYELSGKPRDAWNPDFNSLSLFDVSHVHSVTSVSSFAPEARFAISGWFQLGR